MSPPSDGARPVAHKIEWVCTECAYTGSDFRLHTDRESGHVDDVICGRCGSPSTEEIDDTSLREIAETIKKERADYDALRAELERLSADRETLQRDGTHPAPCGRYCEATAFTIEIRNLRRRAEAAEAKVAKLSEAIESYLEFPNTGPADDFLRAALNEGWGKDGT